MKKIEQETNRMNVVSENGFHAVTSGAADLSRLNRIAFSKLNISLKSALPLQKLVGDQLTLYVLFFNGLDSTAQNPIL